MKKLLTVLLVTIMIFSSFANVFAYGEAHNDNLECFVYPQVIFEENISARSIDESNGEFSTNKELKLLFQTQIHQMNSEFTFNLNRSVNYFDFKKTFDLKNLYDDGYFSAVIKKISASSLHQSDGSEASIKFTIEYRHTQKQEYALDDEVDSLLAKIVGNKKSDYEKIKMVNDYIVLNSAYSLDTTGTPYSPHTLFFEKKGVCQAYALLAYKMLYKLGFEVKFVTGTSGGKNHGWNLVKVDGEWYHLDTTHNDPIVSSPENPMGSDAEDCVYYTSFLRSDQGMLTNHTSKYNWDQSKFPPALSNKFEDKNTGHYKYTQADYDWLMNKGGESNILPKINYPGTALDEHTPDNALIPNHSEKTVANFEELKAAYQDAISQLKSSFTVVYTGLESPKPLFQRIENDELNNDKYFDGLLTDYKYGYSKKGTGPAYITFELNYHHTPEQEQELDQEVDKLLNKIKGNKKDDYEKIKMVNDYIVLKSSYSTFTTGSAHSPYTLFFEKKGVCQAYALLAYKMLDKLGYEVKYITGKLGDVAHGWNLVKVDREWYHLDATYNDPLVSSAEHPDEGSDVKDCIYYNTFLKSDNDMSSEYSWDHDKFPHATSKRFKDKNIGEYHYTKDDYDWLNNEAGTPIEPPKPPELIDELDPIQAFGTNTTPWPEKVEAQGRNHWTVNFNYPIATKLYPNNCAILKSVGINGTRLDISVDVKDNILKLYAKSEQPFEKGVYYLVIYKGFPALNGKTLPKTLYMKFTIK